ncbi:DUF3703 domain-containing protein [Paraglaciecola hydrolytica]|uniref:DUF3703 domain-containing protein n=1 Tax=Paraglaciecola hydrolytica TaxID=1799789 RepID=A0A136A657_9ALTE|nr:DUF3703 domain-containing protein [Paraglaciecola hydrolytica]KXI30717.1 hypothetical protein AX660_04640 [Paraglaciecola hydrolytica]
MSSFTQKISPFVQHEIALANESRNKGELNAEFSHLENAHVLGQESTYHHVKVHYLMLLWGFRQKRLAEVMGQMFRIFGALTKTMLGFVPAGNTGGSNISPFKRLPIKPELANIIQQAKNNV